MKLHRIDCQLKIFDSIDELTKTDAMLINLARMQLDKPHAPYSKFLVVSCAILNNGSVVYGVNIENNSYGATICAERTLIGNIITNYKNEKIDTIALVYHHIDGLNNTPITPCGICRQSFMELIKIQKQDIRLISTGISGNIWIFDKISKLLPYSFDHPINLD